MTIRNRRLGSCVRVRTMLAAFLVDMPPSQGDAQSTYRACRVPDVGAVYMIGLVGTPDQCLDPGHIEFSWTEGLDSISDGAVGSAKIADGAVTASKVADGSLGTDKFAPGVMMWVRVNANGSTAGSSGAVTSIRLGTGSYRVSFPEPLEPVGSCGVVGSPHESGRELWVRQRSDDPANLPGDGDVLTSVYNSGGNAIDNSFSLIVLCNR